MVNNGSKESQVKRTYFAETRESDVQFAYRATAAAIVRWAERMQADREVQVRVVSPTGLETVLTSGGFWRNTMDGSLLTAIERSR